MNTIMMAVAEQLACESAGTEASVVMHTVCECVDAFPDVDPVFIEHAARARLALVDGGLGGNDGSTRRP